MENNRGNVIVIFAGYTESMQRFLDRNPGMLSRIAFQIEFEDYTTDELCDIARLMASKKQIRITDAAMNKPRELITTIEACDIPDMAARKRAIKRIGFAC